MTIAIHCLIAGTAFGQQTVQLHWYKGNTHAHTLNSDGDSTADDVVKRYRLHGS